MSNPNFQPILIIIGTRYFFYFKVSCIYYDQYCTYLCCPFTKISSFGHTCLNFSFMTLAKSPLIKLLFRKSNSSRKPVQLSKAMGIMFLTYFLLNNVVQGIKREGIITTGTTLGPNFVRHEGKGKLSLPLVDQLKFELYLFSFSAATECPLNFPNAFDKGHNCCEYKFHYNDTEQFLRHSDPGSKCLPESTVSCPQYPCRSREDEGKVVKYVVNKGINKYC